MTDPSSHLFAIALAAMWCGFGLCGVLRSLKRSPQAREMLHRFRKAGLSARASVIVVLVAVVSIGGTKPGGGNGGGLRSGPMATEISPPEPTFVLVEVRTNGVVFAAPSTNATVSETVRRHGTNEGGEWIETETPFFFWGTNTVSRVYASPACLSFGTMNHPALGAMLPDGSTAESLVALRAPLGMVPETNWPLVFGQDCPSPDNPCGRSIFWHDAAPGRGRVFTWENALIDRLPGHRVSVQAELSPCGDFTCRYYFKDALYSPTTNLVIGIQSGTNAITALSMVGTNIVSAPVWRVDGVARPPDAPMFPIDLLCTNGVLRAPAAFELRWKSTTGLCDLSGDTDGDGLSDWMEIRIHGTDHAQSDTDGDGISDGDEVLAGGNPLDADENADGVPDGITPAEWAANPLWATNSPSGGNVTITLEEAIPAGACASLAVGDLCIPLGLPDSWTLALPTGTFVPYRLCVSPPIPVTLSAETATGSQPLVRGPTRSASDWGEPLWWDGPAFDGPSTGGSGNIAIPRLSLLWIDPLDGSHGEGGVCLHAGTDAYFDWVLSPQIAPHSSGTLELEGFAAAGDALRLPVPQETGVSACGEASLAGGILGRGSLVVSEWAHRCTAAPGSPFCSVCGCYEPWDIELDATKTLLTLKHDNQTTLTVTNRLSPGESVPSPGIEIRRTDEDEWSAFPEGTVFDPWTARIAGCFQLRATSVSHGRKYFSEPIDIEVRFPCYDEIVSDPDVIGFMTNAWNDAVEECSPTLRRERGFWINLDTVSGLYEPWILVIGTNAAFSMRGGVKLGQPIWGYPEYTPSPISSGNTYSVASFHTHTPIQYVTNYYHSGRTVGPSDKDIESSVSTAHPGIVFDYFPVPFSVYTNRIPHLHPKDSAARPYPVGPPERRPTP